MNAEDVLFYGHDFVHRNLGDVPESEWDTPNVCGWWSSKQIIAHLASFEWMLVDILDTFRGEAPGPTLTQMIELGGEGFNQVMVAARDAKSPAEVLSEYDLAFEKAHSLLKQIPLDVRRRVGTLPWYGDEYDLEDFLTYSYYGHKREHTAQINVFLDRLKRS